MRNRHCILVTAILCIQALSQDLTLQKAGEYVLQNAYAVFVKDSLVYVACQTSGLSIIDVSDPAAPVLKGSCSVPGTARDVAVAGAYAYVAAYDEDLQVVDVSRPDSPSVVGSYNFDGRFHDVWVMGNHAYLADNTQGVQVIDITDPANPIHAANIPTGGVVEDIHGQGDYIYLAMYSSSYNDPGGLLIVDVARPDSAVTVGTYQQNIYSYDVWVSGNYAYIANWTNGMVIVDISNPASPTRVEARASAGYSGSLGMEDSIVYVGTGSHSVDAINVADPDSIFSYGHVGIGGNPISIHAAGGYAYVVDDSRGLLIYHLAPAPAVETRMLNSGTGLRLEQNGTYLRYDTGLSSSGTITVYNPAGQAVLSRAVRGRGNVGWEGGGRPAGLYVCRLATSYGKLEKKILSVR